jgi:hypothetical protein
MAESEKTYEKEVSEGRILVPDEPTGEPMGEHFFGYSFKELFSTFVGGTPVKRRGWRGYWKYDPRLRNIKMFTKEGKVLLLTDTDDILFTISHISEYDWEIATNENCDIEVK